jgi:peptide deformylase
MAKLVEQNHPALHNIAEEVSVSEITSSSIQKVIKDMHAVLNNYAVEGFNGVAIAAPQIGVALRIFIVHNTNTDPDDTHTIPDLVAINPSIIKSSKQHHIVGEGCLSVGEHYGAIRRAKNVTLRAYDKNGILYERGAGGILAQIFQHEVDHLDGILFIDKAEKVWHKNDIHAQHITEAQEQESE